MLHCSYMLSLLQEILSYLELSKKMKFIRAIFYLDNISLLFNFLSYKQSIPLQLIGINYA